MTQNRRKELEKSRLLCSSEKLLLELQLSTHSLPDVSATLWVMSRIARYLRWFSQSNTVNEWHKLLERNELVFLSKLRPKTADLKDFKQSLYAAIGKAETSKLTPEELQRLWDRRSDFFIDATSNIEDFRQIVVKRDKHRCRYCGVEEPTNQKLHLHHVIPKEKYGGANTVRNLVAACSSCNLKIGQDIEFPMDWQFGMKEYASSSV